jgi:hypothetical protein
MPSGLGEGRKNRLTEDRLRSISRDKATNGSGIGSTPMRENSTPAL